MKASTAASILILSAVLLDAPLGLAQTSAPGDPFRETVTVTGERALPGAVIHDFVRSYVTTASSAVDEISRWRKPVCPGTSGLSEDRLNQFVTDRIRIIADRAGVPVAAKPCQRNIEVIFTPEPQKFLDQVRTVGPALLGAKRSEVKAVAMMTHAVQAWYATGVVDLSGHQLLDDEDRVGFSGNFGKHGLDALTNLPHRQVYGSILQTGMRSEMAHVYIVADSGKTGDLKLGPVADYIAMLALSQTSAFEVCRPLASISNLMAPECPAALKPDSITDADMAYLTGLYRMDPGANFQTQKSDIAAAMEISLSAPPLGSLPQ